MTDKKEETQNISTLKNLPKASPHLVIKNIPSSLSDEQVIDIFKKNFEGNIRSNGVIVKLEKKYSTKNRNKICFITVESLDIRTKIFEFFSTFELIDPKGYKQKLTVNDCLLQNKIKGTEDTIGNTIDQCEHFLKFKEYFEKDKLIDFKSEEDKCKLIYIKILDSSKIFEGVPIEESKNAAKGKMIITKKNNQQEKNEENIIIIGGKEKEKDKEERENKINYKEEIQHENNIEVQIEVIQGNTKEKYGKNFKKKHNKKNDYSYNNNGYDNYNKNYDKGHDDGKGRRKGNDTYNNDNYYNGNDKKGHYDNNYNNRYYEGGGYGNRGYKGGYRKGGYSKGYK